MADRSPELSGKLSAAWIVIFTDMVALLLTFFVMLFSMSSVKLDKWTEIIDALSRTLNPAKEEPVVVPTAEYNISTIFRKRAINLDYLQAVFKQKIARDELIQDSPIVHLNDRIVISLSGDLLFPQGSAQPTEEARQALFLLGGVLRNINNTLGVNGYSEEDNFSSSAFASNWELSLARAIAVANELKRAGYTDEILSFGYGKSRSPALKDFPEDRRRILSRRVDIVIMSTGGVL